MAVPTVGAVLPTRAKPIPNDRLGVVVGFRAQSGVANVALRNGRMLAIHTDRRVGVGNQVRINGIKWGTPTRGITWDARPPGVAYGIKWGRNGTYQARLTPIRRTGVAPIRGVVVKRFGRAVAVGTPGGTVIVRMAVWLPGGGKRAKGAERPDVGATVLIDTEISRTGRLIGRQGVETLRQPAADVLVPVAGTLNAIDTGARTLTIASAADSAYPLLTTVGVPQTIDLGEYRVGQELSVTARVAPNGRLTAAQISRNESFAAANDPANIQFAPPPADTATLALMRDLVDRWSKGRADGQVTDQAVYDRELARLTSAERSAKAGDRAAARLELDGFLLGVASAIPDQVQPVLAAEVLALAGAVRDRLM